jgi:hypothetical protein
LRYGSTTFLTLSNPAYSAASSNLVWSGTVPSTVTIPAGQALSYVISNYQSGVGYRLDYDSSSKPSKIILPTTTVIHISALGVYDAPYPGGNLVSTPLNGSTLHVRVAVTDPFGSYDIYSVALDNDGPGTADDLTTTLIAANVVANDGCTKTYEYIWQTASTPGTYNISATAEEGTEGITDVAATSVTLAVQDTGTPSTAAFTSGSNGPTTNSYAANQTICVLINDADQNTDAAVAESLTAIVTSGTGDSEILTPTNSFIAQEVLPAPIGTNAAAGVPVDKEFMDSRFGAPRFVIEFTSIPGRVYTILYSSSINGPWKAATPSIAANATKTQWCDDGPPKTEAAPLSVSDRFYRVLVAPSNL